MVSEQDIMRGLPQQPKEFGEKNYLLAVFEVLEGLNINVWLIQNPMAPEYHNHEPNDSPTVALWERQKLGESFHDSYLATSFNYTTKIGKLLSVEQSSLIWYFGYLGQIGYNEELLKLQRESSYYPSVELALELGCTRTGMEYLYYTPCIQTRIGASSGYRGFWTPEFSYNTQQEN